MDIIQKYSFILPKLAIFGFAVIHSKEEKKKKRELQVNNPLEISLKILVSLGAIKNFTSGGGCESFPGR